MFTLNSKKIFCNQLAEWFSAQSWHFTTLLSVLIEVVDNLPGDADQLVNEILQELTGQASTGDISSFLENSRRVRHWFSPASAKPTVNLYSLQSPPANIPVNNKLPKLDTVGDLSAWLGTTCGQLDWLADLKRHDSRSPAYFSHYHYSIVVKRDGRKRLIESPKSLLKVIQKQIMNDILQSADSHEAAHGFVKGRNCNSHASLHVGKNYLFLFDLAHCFHSIQWLNVFRVFANLGYSPRVNRYLTALVTHRAYSNHPLLRELDSDQHNRLRQRHLPQGAPGSPALSNAVLMQLDKRLFGLAQSLKLGYSRYADDLAFSGNNHRDWAFLEPLVGSICNEQGFALNYRKSRILRPSQRQILTGIVVNEKPNIDRRYYDRLRAVLTNCARHGLNSQNRSNHADFRAHLLGCIQHVKSLNEIKGKKLQSIFEQIAC